MKHRPVFVLLFLVALSLTSMGQENPVRGGENPPGRSGKTTDDVNSISLVGEVDYPGIYIMSKPLTLRDAILFAGGLDVAAARYGYLYRRVTERKEAQDSDLNDQTKLLENPESSLPGTKMMQIDLEPMKRGGVPEPNILMEAGDIFFIPRRAIQHFYVVGDVVKPGAYEIESGRPILASQAIAKAGGPLETAKMSKGILVRFDEKGERQQLKVDFGDILRGENEDFEVFPDDIIFIPGSKAKTLGFGLLSILDNPANRKSDTPKFYIIGEVGNPGAYEIESDRPILASQAIAKAGGPLKTARMSNGMLIRYDEKGKRQELNVDLGAILRGKDGDFEILPRDIIFIPGR